MSDLNAKIGIIGGSGLYDLDGLEKISETSPQTPYGPPSDSILIGKFGGKEVAFLPRHGKGHHIAPHQIPVQANIAALKMIGVEQILSFSSVGSLRAEIPPCDFALPSQIIDRTKGNRPFTYYEDGLVVHTAFGDPFSEYLADIIWKKRSQVDGLELHRDKTLVCMEGPVFSTRAESNMYRGFGADLINMSVLPEAKLAAELEIDYQMICMSTDFDSWKEDEEHVTTEYIISNLKTNAKHAKKLIEVVLPELDGKSRRTGTLKNAVITAPDKRNPATVQKLNQLLPGYF